MPQTETPIGPPAEPTIPPRPARRRRCVECDELFHPAVGTSEATCPECRRPRCPYCGYRIDAEALTEYEGRPYHASCIITCAVEGCGHRTLSSDSDMYYCWDSGNRQNEVRACSEHVHNCTNCNSGYTTDNHGGHVPCPDDPEAGESWICQRCYSHYFECPGCETHIHEDYAGGHADDNEEIRYCHPCYRTYVANRTPEQREAWERREREIAERAAEAERRARREAMRRPLALKRHAEHDPSLKEVCNDYSFRPRPTFYRLDDDGREALYQGWEIEAEAPRDIVLNQRPEYGHDAMGRAIILPPVQGPVPMNRLGVLERYVFPLKEVYAKSDSSITFGAELVSHPGTYRFWKNYNWDFLNRLREHGWRSFDTESCGMHVHLSRDQFTNLEQAKMVKFFRDNARLVEDLSRRPGSLNFKKYASVNTQESIVGRWLQAGRGHRYSAVNLQNEKTLEIRIFRGTLNPAGVIRNLALCQAIGKFVKTASVADLSASTFSAWLDAKGSVYLGRKMGVEIAQWVRRAIAPVDTGC